MFSTNLRSPHLILLLKHYCAKFLRNPSETAVTQEGRVSLFLVYLLKKAIAIVHCSSPEHTGQHWPGTFVGLAQWTAHISAWHCAWPPLQVQVVQSFSFHTADSLYRSPESDTQPERRITIWLRLFWRIITMRIAIWWTVKRLTNIVAHVQSLV